MSILYPLSEIVAHAAKLLALAAAPPLVSPAPPAPAHPLLEAALALVVLTLPVLTVARLLTRSRTLYALVGGGLLLIAVVCAIVCATVLHGTGAPLGRALLWVALPLWVGLAVIAGEVISRRLERRSQRARPAVAVVVLGGGVLLLASQSGWLFSPQQMWWQALRQDGDNVAAVDAILQEPLRARNFAAAREVLERCLVASPNSCACLARRSQIDLRRRDVEVALADARSAVKVCPDDPGARTALVAALAYRGDAVEAEVEARVGLAQRDDPRLHYALALALDRQAKRAEALEEGRRAVDGGAGRDAALLLGAMAIHAGDLELAARALAPVIAADANDAEAQYDLALVADKKNEFNNARQGYLAALRSDPDMADARYNLALLTLRYGAVDEARHHAKKFGESAPADPRNADLWRLLANAAPRR